MVKVSAAAYVHGCRFQAVDGTRDGRAFIRCRLLVPAAAALTNPSDLTTASIEEVCSLAGHSFRLNVMGAFREVYPTPDTVYPAEKHFTRTIQVSQTTHKTPGGAITLLHAEGELDLSERQMGEGFVLLPHEVNATSTNPLYPADWQRILGLAFEAGINPYRIHQMLRWLGKIKHPEASSMNALSRGILWIKANWYWLVVAMIAIVVLFLWLAAPKDSKPKVVRLMTKTVTRARDKHDNAVVDAIQKVAKARGKEEEAAETLAKIKAEPDGKKRRRKLVTMLRS